MFAYASAALGIIARAGLGKVRHLRTQALWLQEARQEGRLKFTKVPGEENPWDAGTKHMAAPLLERHVAAMGAKFEEGLAASAPDLKSMEEEQTAGRHPAPILVASTTQFRVATETMTRRSSNSLVEFRNSSVNEDATDDGTASSLSAGPQQRNGKAIDSTIKATSSHSSMSSNKSP